MAGCRCCCVGSGSRTRHSLLAGIEGAAGEVSRSCNPRSRLWRNLAWAEELEWRRHSRSRHKAHRNARGLPGDPDDTHSRYIEAAVDGLALGCLICRTAIRRRGQSSITSCTGSTAEHACRRAARAEKPVVLAGEYNVMRLNSMSISPSAGSITRCFGRRCVKPISVFRSRVDGCATRAAPRRAPLHVLGLFPECLRAQCGITDRPFAPQSIVAPARRRCRSRGARLGQSERSCARLGRTRPIATRTLLSPGSVCKYVAPPPGPVAAWKSTE